MGEQGWIGVDLDGTLANYDEWLGAGVIGEPVPLMRDRVMRWLNAGVDVRIMTARVAGDYAVVEERAIQNWCQEHLGRVLPVTCCKDHLMRELWDDRAVRVVKNAGIVSDGREVIEPKVEPGDIGAVM